MDGVLVHSGQGLRLRRLSQILQTFYHYKVNYFNYFFSYSGCDNL
jgi:hypothetical protein